VKKPINGCEGERRFKTYPNQNSASNPRKEENRRGDIENEREGCSTF